ncbi:DUF2093 domain-containing protein [Teichococcus oryzae]|uniref:DUF2093 domain-containing protein n=1 Tax=Teichococcus oryzae TaxID=1608942 RepID=A0A5B2TJ48_9PROT|nr:DUF2093 domain-containing protein [Pseudoroseomonas oryzae]KAA2213820.1 DUF2093 domain-containing protein [Pseudoroseomonas oryzae]
MSEGDAAPGKLAVLRYGTPDFTVLEPGDHVICAVSFRRIPLERLLYWSADAQEAYAGAAEAAEAAARRRPRGR